MYENVYEYQNMQHHIQVQPHKLKQVEFFICLLTLRAAFF
jgi:hypothetical protein